jgi:hypothetical protein
MRKRTVFVRPCHRTVLPRDGLLRGLGVRVVGHVRAVRWQRAAMLHRGRLRDRVVRRRNVRFTVRRRFTELLRHVTAVQRRRGLSGDVVLRVRRNR